MMETTMRITVSDPEGYVRLKDLRDLVARSQDMDPNAVVSAGLSEDNDVYSIDILYVEGVPIDTLTESDEISLSPDSVL